MGGNLMQQLARYEGYCCATHYHIAHLEWTQKQLAKHLGVATQTVSYWRKWLRERTVDRCSLCPKEVVLVPPQSNPE